LLASPRIQLAKFLVFYSSKSRKIHKTEDRNETHDASTAGPIFECGQTRQTDLGHNKSTDRTCSVGFTRSTFCQPATLSISTAPDQKFIDKITILVLYFSLNENESQGALRWADDRLCKIDKDRPVGLQTKN
jgi:hypothetical protein